ncbi:MAG: EAL domain-containing protein [Burkholderiaceae bacterium]
MNASPTLITPRRRPVASFAVVVLAGALLSQLTVGAGAELALVWLPTSLVLVGLLTRGPSVLLPAVFGLLVFRLAQGSVDPAAFALEALALLAGPLAAAQLIRMWRQLPGRQSHVVQAQLMFLVLIFVQAPVSALLRALSLHVQGSLPLSFVGTAGLLTLVEAATALVFVRGILTWMPGEGSGFCPVAGSRDARTRLSLRDVVPYAAVVILGLAYVVAIYVGHSSLARLVMFPMFAVASASALWQSRRQAGSVMMFAFFGILALRAKIPPDMMDFYPQPLLLMLLLAGFGLLHLLSALTEERRAQQSRLRRMALSNEVSGLPNLRALGTFLAQLGQRGEAPGERLQLAEVATPDLARRADLVGRADVMRAEREIGRQLRLLFGEPLRLLVHIATGRFILVLTADLSDEDIIERLQGRFERHAFQVGEQSILLRCSVGVVPVPPGRHDTESLLTSLSIAQQQAAAMSRRYHRLSLDEDQLRVYREALAQVDKVRDLFARDQIMLYAQPIAPASMSADAALHFEVLARMLDDDGTVLTPDQFLPQVSRAGLQIDFDRRIIVKTLAYLASDQALLANLNLCAVNVCGPTVCDPGFVGFLEAALKRYGIDPRLLAIEITESETIADFEAALANVRALGACGVSVAVDDFGSGQATFQYIRRFSPGLLKIDGSFVRRYNDDPLDCEIVHSIVRLAQAIGARTVAEFVESEQLIESMRDIGVDFLQGWAIARPMPLGQIKAYCDHRRQAMRAGQGQGGRALLTAQSQPMSEVPSRAVQDA